LRIHPVERSGGPIGDEIDAGPDWLDAVKIAEGEPNAELLDRLVVQRHDKQVREPCLGYDVLVKTVYTLNSIYRQNAVWVMNSNTARTIMQLKDQQLRPLWVDGLAQGQPTRLLGYPTVIWEQMPDIDVTGGGNSTFPVAFGDFRRGYLMVDRVGLRLIVDNVTTLGKVRFYISKRTGGCVLNPDAIKWIKTAA
jgi:HK97 family phage major capsid protein